MFSSFLFLLFILFYYFNCVEGERKREVMGKRARGKEEEGEREAKEREQKWFRIGQVGECLERRVPFPSNPHKESKGPKGPKG